MKYVIVLCDGAADYDDARGLTPLDEANKPTIDALIKTSRFGTVQTVPNGVKPGSDVANLSVLGYAPDIYYTGRSPLEAASLGIDLNDNDVTYRVNLVTLSNDAFENKIMQDYGAGEITTAESRELIAALQPAFKGFSELHSGTSYRHLAVIRNGKPNEIVLTPPHDISGKTIGEYLPKGVHAPDFIAVMKNSIEILRDHPVNAKRRKEGKHTADCVWFWGEGTRPALKNFEEKTGKRAAMISAVDLLKGIAKLSGMDSIDVDGATGTVDTNFDGKAKAAIAALNTHDFVYVHLEAPDECGHQGDRANKILSIERIDKQIVKPIVDALNQSGERFRIMILPDHPTPLATRTHASDPVPFFMYDSAVKVVGTDTYSEKAVAKGEKLLNGGDITKLLFD